MSFINTYLTLCLPVFVVVVTDYTYSEGQNDGGRHANGRLSAAERNTELFPEHHIQRCGHQGRRRLLAV